MRPATKLIGATACALATASCALIWGIDEPQPEPSDDGGLADAYVCTSTLDAGVGDGSPPSCAGDGPGIRNCGPNENESCCANSPVYGGTFYRDFDNSDASSDKDNQASVNTFYLDNYEVTVGRFRKFVQFVIATQWQPCAGWGKHSYLYDGGGLNGGTEPGWESGWPTLLATAEEWTSQLTANGSSGSSGTWTPDPGPNENLPITNVSWYQLYAFCIWDGGFLPTEAEWNYAAAGGEEQRTYPWSDPAGSDEISCQNANVGDRGPDGGPCNGGHMMSVGMLEAGLGLYGQFDLGGNAVEWVLDGHITNSYYPGDGGPDNDCNNCANLTDDGERIIYGGSAVRPSWEALVASRSWNYANRPYVDYGGRCARPAPP